MINSLFHPTDQTKRFMEGVVRAAIGFIILGLMLLYFLETRVYVAQKPSSPLFGAPRDNGERPAGPLPSPNASRGGRRAHIVWRAK